MAAARRALIVLLWAAGILTIGRAGVLYAAMFTMGQGIVPEAWGAANLQLSLWYTGGVLAILAAHEGGHWLACRLYGVQTSGPFLIPVPISWAHLFAWLWLPAIGTIGAFLRISGRPPSRAAQWDIAYLGLSAGFLVTLICAALGACWSVPYHSPRPMGRFWTPHLLQWMAPNRVWHPVMSAAWVGWALTTTSLLPIPPMDGWRLFWNLDAAWHNKRRIAVVGFGCICLCCWL